MKPSKLYEALHALIGECVLSIRKLKTLCKRAARITPEMAYTIFMLRGL